MSQDMFEWKADGPTYVATTDAGNEYIVQPLIEDEPDGQWTCTGYMASGEHYSAFTRPNESAARAFAEELEVQSWS